MSDCFRCFCFVVGLFFWLLFCFLVLARFLFVSASPSLSLLPSGFPFARASLGFPAPFLFVRLALPFWVFTCISIIVCYMELLWRTLPTFRVFWNCIIYPWLSATWIFVENIADLWVFGLVTYSWLSAILNFRGERCQSCCRSMWRKAKADWRCRALSSIFGISGLADYFLFFVGCWFFAGCWFYA